MANHYIVVPFQQVAQRLASLFHICYLFLISALLAAAQQRIAAESHHSKFLHFLCILLVTILLYISDAGRLKVQIYTFFLNKQNPVIFMPPKAARHPRRKGSARLSRSGMEARSPGQQAGASSEGAAHAKRASAAFYQLKF